MASCSEQKDGLVQDCEDVEDISPKKEDGEDTEYFDEASDREEIGSQSIMNGCTPEQITHWMSLVQTMGINSDAEQLRKSDFQNKVFVSIDQAEYFYMLYSKLMGFSVRKKVKRSNTKGVVTCRSWVCSSEGKREEKRCKLENRTAEIRPLTRTGCQASFVIKLVSGQTNWYVDVFNHHHNHKMAKGSEKSFLRSNRKVSDAAREQALAMKRAGIPTCNIYKYQAQMTRGWSTLGYLKNDLYRGIRKKYATWEDTDTQTAIAFLESKKGPDAKFFYKFEVDEDNRLTNLFWSEGMCQADYKLFGDCLAFDSTYKTNRYGKPLVLLIGTNNHDKTCAFGAALLQHETAETYVWLLETFLECMNQNKPKTVLTDGCKSMNKALQTVMPDIPHRICSWHILKNAMQHVRGESFNTDLKMLIYRYYEEDEWEKKWTEMVQKVGKEKKESHTWIQALYTTKTQWADTFLRNHYFGGAKATGRCESMNALLKNGLESNIPLWMFFRQYDACLSHLHFNEMREHFVTNQTDSLPGQTSMPALEAAVSSMFTRAIFLKIKGEMKRSEKYIVSIDNQSDPDHAVCEVRIYGVTAPKRIVKISKDLANVEFMECSCYYFVAKAYPCRHMFASLKYLNITKFPLCLVNRRWRKDLKSVEELVFDTEVHSNHPEAAQHERYAIISKQTGVLSHLASRSKEAFGKAMKVILDLNVELDKIPKDADAENANGPERSCPTPVKDANKSTTKGRPTVASKRRKSNPVANKKSEVSRKRKKRNRCKDCGRTGHDRRNCLKFQDIEEEDEEEE